MRAKITVVALVLLGLCTWMAYHAIAAPPGPGPVTGPVLVTLPDLIIKQVVIKRVGGGEFPPFEFYITVKNKGAGIVGTSTTGIVYVQDIGASASPVSAFAAAPTPSIPAGGQVTVKVTRTGPFGKIYLVFLADAPTAGKPLGKLLEGLTSSAYEQNNSLTVPFDIAKGTNQTFTNPAP